MKPATLMAAAAAVVILAVGDTALGEGDDESKGISIVFLDESKVGCVYRRVQQSSKISKNDLEGTKSPWATWASAAVDPARRPWAIQQSTKDFLNQ